MEDNYPKAYKEVLEILNFVPEESVNKIPKTMIETFKINMDKNHNFRIDMNKNFEEQNMLYETKAIFANIFRDYWSTSYQKERIENKEKYDRQELEEAKRIKYNPNDIFNKPRNEKENFSNEIQNNNLPIEVKKEVFFQKIIQFFKKIFHI